MSILVSALVIRSLYYVNGSMRGSRSNKIHPRGNSATVRSIPAVFPQHSYPNPRDSRCPHPHAHLYTVLASCASLMYALRVLRSHGLSEQSLTDVFLPTVVGRLLYCAPAWSGFCSAADCTRLNSFLHRICHLDNHISRYAFFFKYCFVMLYRYHKCH